MGIMMLLVIAGIVSQVKPITSSQLEADTRFTVVIDAGHGGSDPGKIGVNNALEKEINLSIAYKLKAFLEANDVNVVLTRDTDSGLYSSRDKNKKMADMKARCKTIEDAKPDMVISIHQNSFPQESVKGAQTFYYKNSDKGELLAKLIQKEFSEMKEQVKQREIKANDNYYLLLHVTAPIVIVECGFLSNPSEAALLISDEYQEKLAWAIHMGAMNYLNQK